LTKPNACVPAEALALTLAAAFLHAGWNVFLRGSEDVEARTAVVIGLSLLLFAPVAAATWSVSWSVAPYVAASAALEGLYFALLVAAYRRRELSVVYPVARGSAPVLVLLGTVAVLGRNVSVGASVGVCLVAAGVVLVRGIRRGAEGVLVALAIGCAIAGYTLVDKEGLQHAAAIPYLELVLLPVALVAVPLAAVRRGTQTLQAQLTWSTLVAAVASFGAYALVLAALRLASAPEVAAVRETSVVIAALLAGTFLRERVGIERLAGAAAVAGGVALIALS
jgi:drug/metabolite transporter (DMT)-like permease